MCRSHRSLVDFNIYRYMYCIIGMCCCHAFFQTPQAIAKSGLCTYVLCLMIYRMSHVLCLVSCVLHIAFAYMLMFSYAYVRVLMFRDLIRQCIARSCFLHLHRVPFDPLFLLHLRDLHAYWRIRKSRIVTLLMPGCRTRYN